MSSALPLGWRVRAVAAVGVVAPLVAVRSFARLARWLGHGAGGAPLRRVALDDAALARWVDRVLYALRGPWRHTCLRRATVLYGLLRRAGRPVELVIGVRRDAAGRVAAHAWLERDAAPYLEADPAIPARHTVLARFPDDGGPSA
ncbi:MAG TPA: lasso peptide biosynthesis B2 protein [Gemmatimonadales bacterium]|nr:lasso peptide biosynthesis B2 protein [Gemmatimonadales bacterium]